MMPRDSIQRMIELLRYEAEAIRNEAAATIHQREQDQLNTLEGKCYNTIANLTTLRDKRGYS